LLFVVFAVHLLQPGAVNWLPTTFRCDIPVVFCRLNTKYISSSQNTTKFIALCCTICYATTCFGPLFRPSSGCIRLALRVMYPDDKVYYFDDEISNIL